MNISTNNLAIGYGQKVVQKGLTFSLESGHLIALLGPNGCGKTTLLRTLAGLQPMLDGTISPCLTEKNMALVLTEKASLDNTCVHDIVAMGRYPYLSFLGGLSRVDEDIIQHALQAVGALEWQGTMFNALSDGEKQQVLIAKSLAQQTELILLDEPTAHLDLPNRIRIFQLLRTLAHEQGKTILLSTHELHLALKTCDQTLLMGAQGVRMIDLTSAPLPQAEFNQAFGMDIFANDCQNDC